MVLGAIFFKYLLSRPIPRIAIENPIMHKYAKEIINEPYTQIIQPYQYGHKESKSTCLWLKGLPPLKSTNVVLTKDELQRYGSEAYQVKHRLPSSCDRWKERSRTYKGIAEAMATQWG